VKLGHSVAFSGQCGLEASPGAGWEKRLSNKNGIRIVTK
jgi:hypothetical protein